MCEIHAAVPVPKPFKVLDFDWNFQLVLCSLGRSINGIEYMRRNRKSERRHAQFSSMAELANSRRCIRHICGFHKSIRDRNEVSLDHQNDIVILLRYFMNIQFFNVSWLFRTIDFKYWKTFKTSFSFKWFRQVLSHAFVSDDKLMTKISVPFATHAFIFILPFVKITFSLSQQSTKS